MVRLNPASASVDGAIATIDLIVFSEGMQPIDIRAMLDFLEGKARKRALKRIRADQATGTVIARLAGDEWLDREITAN